MRDRVERGKVGENAGLFGENLGFSVFSHLVYGENLGFPVFTQRGETGKTQISPYSVGVSFPCTKCLLS